MTPEAEDVLVKCVTCDSEPFLWWQLDYHLRDHHNREKK